MSQRIISYDERVFTDRDEAGKLLAEQLMEFRKLTPIVVAIPRGGVIIGHRIAKAMNIGLDILLSRKLGAPDTPELALGAITEDGTVSLNEALIAELNIPRQYIEDETARQKEEIQRRIAIFRPIRSKTRLTDKTVIVTDDGAATGATLQAALWACRHESPKMLICAIPAGSEQAVTRLSRDCDLLVALSVPPFFNAVSQTYENFPQITDEQVLKILRKEEI